MRQIEEVGTVRRRAVPQPILITTAPQSPAQEFAGRRRQYAIVMSIRVMCFILAVVITVTWLRVVFMIGAVVLPWVAVIAANQVHGKLTSGPKLYVPAPRPALTAGEQPDPHRTDRRS